MMKFDHRHYVPCLRWKQGEYQAVSRFHADTKEKFTPLIEVPEIGWDFENGTLVKSVDEHLKPLAKRIKNKWGGDACFVDLNLIDSSVRMKNGDHPLKYLFEDFRNITCTVIPVTGLDRDAVFQQEVKNVTARDKQGICLRMSLGQAARNTIKTEIDSLITFCSVQPNHCDLVLDLQTPNFTPLDGFSLAIQAVARKLPYLKLWRTFTIIGTSFPDSMGVLKAGGNTVPRSEWELYKLLCNFMKDEWLRVPTFGDYAISHPQVLDLDMRVIKPSATIRYTIDGAWYIVKGSNVRDYGFDQYQKMSERIINSQYYCGSSFSWGDGYIQNCANGSGSTGNLMMWRQVGTNHHIIKVIQDLASFYASSNEF